MINASFLRCVQGQDLYITHVLLPVEELELGSKIGGWTEGNISTEVQPKYGAGKPRWVFAPYPLHPRHQIWVALGDKRAWHPTSKVDRVWAPTRFQVCSNVPPTSPSFCPNSAHLWVHKCILRLFGRGDGRVIVGEIVWRRRQPRGRRRDGEVGGNCRGSCRLSFVRLPPVARAVRADQARVVVGSVFCPSNKKSGKKSKKAEKWSVKKSALPVNAMMLYLH